MALGFYKAEYCGITYYFKGLEDGFCCGYSFSQSAFNSTMRSSIKRHEEYEITDRVLLIPDELLNFNNQTEITE